MDGSGRRPRRDMVTRRDAAHRERKRTGTPPPKAERKFRLSNAASVALDIHALGVGQHPSEIVEALILAHCNEWELHRKAGAGQGGAQC